MMYSNSDDLHQCETEKCLLECIQKGNSRAFGKLYDKYAPSLLGLISRTVNDKKIAEGILFAVFLGIREQIAGYDPLQERLFSWMLRIVRGEISKKTGPFEKNVHREIRPSQNIVNHKDESNYSGPDIRNDVNFVSENEHKPNKALDLIFLKGCSYTVASKHLGITEEELKVRIRLEVKELSGVTTA